MTTLQQILHQAPFTAEQLAIDSTNALHAAKIGLRGYRNMPLLCRVIDSFTGAGHENVAAIGSDILVVQEATLHMVDWIMGEQGRSQSCMERVISNLKEIHADLEQLEVDIPHLDRRIQSLEKSLQEINWQIERNETRRRLQNCYIAGELHRGAGSLLQAAFYMAQVGRLFFFERSELIDAEQRDALNVAKQKLNSSPLPVDELVFQTVEEITTLELEITACAFVERTHVLTRTIGGLLVRKLAGLKTGDTEVEDAFTMAPYLYEPSSTQSDSILYPWEFAHRIATEILLEDEKRL